ncbi:MAG: hypothetical protein Q9198_002372 [Flavoplaca austrocitrina]
MTTITGLPATSLDLARPITWSPSQYWESGGVWSSFALRVGNPAQVVRVLISTAGQATWVVSDQGCLPNDRACEEVRGGLFNSNSSVSWEQLGNYSLGLGTNLGPSDNATFGLETIALDSSDATGGPLLAKQIVAAISGEQYPLGVFGLGRQPTNLSDFKNPHPSFLTTLYNQRYIPSLSWGYTAGARYQRKGVFGSLTLGGYDTGRFTPNNVSFDLAQDVARDLVVGLQSIISVESNGSQHLLLPSPHLTFIDSTVPYIYLPSDACALFERVFGLQWDETAQLYLIDDELHKELLMRKPKFTFTLGNSLTGSPTVDIVLPYSSFDLTYKPSYDADPIRYFPLLRSADNSQLTLGRTFLQEAYLITNYEYGNFSVSQCIFEEPMTQNLQAILPSGVRDLVSQPTAPQQPSVSSKGRQSKNSTLNRSTTIGVVLGSVLGLLLLLSMSFGFYICWSRRRRRKLSKTEISATSSGGAQRMFGNKDDSLLAFQSTSSIPSPDKMHEPSLAGGMVAQELDTSDWNLTREIPDSGRMELPGNCAIFELLRSNKSAISDSVIQRPKFSHRLPSSVDQKRRWGLHYSTGGLLSTGNVIKYSMDLLTESYPAEVPSCPHMPSTPLRTRDSYFDRPLPPTPIAESPQESSHHVWTKVAERQHENQSDYPSPLFARDDRYRHRMGFF